MTVAGAARRWQAAGFSTIPILPNATKRPAVRWAEFQVHIPTESDLTGWWENGRQLGLALVMGKVSSNAEMLELEAEAYTPEIMVQISQACDEAGVGEAWEGLTGPLSYSELSPSGGLHVIYRVVDHEVPGNEKIASDRDRHVLAETRGEGGYVIVAPSPGLCHPSGTPWQTIQGEAGSCLSIDWETRCAIHAAIRNILDDPPPDRLPVHADTRTDVVSAYDGATGRPGDHFEATADWSHPLLLGGAGWQRDHEAGGTVYWVRPGKNPRDGISATTGRDAGRDRLWVFSTSTAFPAEEPITKFGAFAILHHAGDHVAAASALRRMGYGDPGSVAQVNSIPSFQFDDSIEGESSTVHTMDDLGARERLAEHVGGNYRWIYEENCYYRWTGQVWEPDHDRQLTREYDAMIYAMLNSSDEGAAKWAKRQRAGSRVTFAVREMRSVAGITMSGSRFNKLDAGKLNLRNGVFDLRTQRLSPHHRDFLLTRTFNASYDPEALCPKWTSFMEEVLPDAEVRRYVQRALGYSLLGDASQRALFLVWGPSGTGKSQFIETIQHVMGDYGVTASLGAFMGGRDKGPSNDVHRLRGKRFVSTSETADDTRFNEEMVKRLTGSDTMSTRALYQQEQEWRPECVIWIATNHKPRFSSDDDAIWRRSKLIPFLTRFGQEDAPAEVDNYARRHLFAERDGILNWLLLGVQAFLKFGLMAPQAILDEAEQHRQEVDSVAMFLQDAFADGKLVEQDNAMIRWAELYEMYVLWCQQTGERRYGRPRFSARIKANLPKTRTARVSEQTHLIGLRRGELWSVRGLFSLTANEESGPPR